MAELLYQHAEPEAVLSGTHFMDGNHAACEGAIAAGCRFAAGYPITPSTEIVERFAERAPHVGAMFIQMEDEIASSICLQGAVWGGLKAMTVTSGPGFSLMMEHTGYAAMTETPCVLSMSSAQAHRPAFQRFPLKATCFSAALDRTGITKRSRSVLQASRNALIS